MPSFDVDKIRKHFPILQRKIRKKPLVYLDNAATTLKPKVVMDSLEHYYLEECANVHRGVHYLSEQATAAFEAARHKIKDCINAAKSCEIIFTRGTTDSINIVAQS